METEARDAMGICGGAPASRAPKGGRCLIEIPTDRVDGISYTVHHWARIVRPMRLVRLKFGAWQRPSSSSGAEQPVPLPATVSVPDPRRPSRTPSAVRSTCHERRPHVPPCRARPSRRDFYIRLVPLAWRAACACTLDSLNLFVHKTVNATRCTRSPSACAPAGHGRQSCRTSAAS